MSSEDFKNLAQGVQAIVLSLAVVVGGLWTLHKYSQSQELNLTRITYENLLKEDKIKPIINIDIHTNYLDNKYLSATTILENKGTRDVDIILNKNLEGKLVKPWRIGLYQDDDHTYNYVTESDVYVVEKSDTLKSETEAISNIYLKAGATQKFNLIYPISQSGIYVVEFRGIPSPQQFPDVSYSFFGQTIITINYE